ncbi:MAG: polyprenyl synthetase family protein [archaeon]|nr:polyprenyl synthetase family protein [archaeon]
MEMNEIAELIKKHGSKADEELKKLIPMNGDPLLQPYLNDPIWHHMGGGGKRIRPAMCLMTCEALGGKTEDAMGFALATEILHNFFLLHDDIEDGDTMRRDIPTVWVKYGLSNGINSGDYMIPQAYKAILNSKIDSTKLKKMLDVFTMTYEKTIEGQALDINSRAKENFSIEEYIKIITLKTSYYLVFTLVGGAIAAGADDKVIQKIWKLGENMGPAFQIRDDIIDLTEGKGRGGEIGCDIKESKPSILYAYVLNKANNEEKNKLLEIMKKERNAKTQQEVDWIIKLYKKYDAIEFAQNYADNLTKEAYKAIDEIPLKNKQIFHDIARFISERKS